MKLTLPELCLVALVGPSGCGKSTFARKHFKSTEVLSSDFCRGLVSDDENSQDATGDAFDVLKYVASKRLTRGLLTVVDATNVQPEARKTLIDLAREHDVLAAAVVLRMPEEVCHERNKGRPDRAFGPHVVRNQSMQLRRGLRGLEREGFRYVYVLNTPEEVEQFTLERQPLWNNRKGDHGPFDIIGDVHGCYDELVELLGQLGYDTRDPEHVVPPAGRKAVFLGDLVDRGPKVVEVLKLVMAMVGQGVALCVPGNHDVKLLRKLRGKNVQVTHGLAETLQQLEGQPPEFLGEVERFIDGLVSHYVFDDGRLVVAHAGMKERYAGRASGRVREFALYGETTGETDEFGLPVRYNWAAEYRGRAHVVYGHTPVPEADWLNRTINIDTGCAFGGKLTALRWPERELASVAARRTYAEPSKPFLPPAPGGGEPPVFGERLADRAYQRRPGAYAVIRDDAGRVAVIRLSTGTFLPGGGSDPGETPEQTLAREVREELGHAVRVRRRLGCATQLCGAIETGLFEKDGTYFEATLGEQLGDPTESDHALEWLEPEAAVAALKHEAQRWAVRCATAPVTPTLSAQQQHDDVLDLADVSGKRIVTTRLHHSVTVRAENATAALEVMSRFAANPKWLIYLPPTMSPSETSDRPGLLEHPQQAFDYFRSQGVEKVVCQEKHMGSRAVAVVCRDEDVALRRFGIRNDGSGIVYTRTGRRFFDDRAVESSLLDTVRQALSAAGFWDEFASDWFCLDCELMPWSAKAQDLLKNQYAAVGSAARAATSETVAILEQAHARYAAAGEGSLAGLLERRRERQTRVDRYVGAYRHYCWPVHSVDDLRLAPFHLLASEGRVHVDRDHAWHMQTLARLATAVPGTPLMATPHRTVNVTDPADCDAATAWWEQLTGGGGEGMVVKPLDFVLRGNKGLVQPAVKCRGPEYLRIIYGPEYDAPGNLERLRRRGLMAKRSLAIREFALGIEALERFVRREPLRRVHECIFGVLALESEPVDPRL